MISQGLYNSKYHNIFCAESIFFFRILADDAVWYDAVLFPGEPDVGKPISFQQLPQTDGLVETRRCSPQDQRLPEETFQHQLVDYLTFFWKLFYLRIGIRSFN